MAKKLVINNQTWTVERVKKLLETNDVAVLKGTCLIYTFQTLDEQKKGHTKHENGVGFGHADSEIMTSFAEQILQKNNITQDDILNNPKVVINKYTLSEKQMKIARKNIIKYGGQIFRHMVAKQAEKQVG